MTEAQAATVQSLFSEALELQSAGKFSEAQQKLERLLALKPDTVEALFHLARIAVETYQFDQALLNAIRAVSLRPGEAVLWLLWAECAALAAQPDAEANFLRLLPRSGLSDADKQALARRFDGEWRGNWPNTNDSVALAEALALRRDGKLEQAIVACRTAAEAAPADARILCELGRLLLDTGDAEEAASVLSRAVILAPRRVVPRALLAEAFNVGEHPARARKQAEAAIRIDPEEIAGHIELYEALRALQEHAASEAAARVMLKVDPTRAASHVGHALALAALDRDDEAMAAFDRALALEPDNFTAAMGKAETLEIRGLFDEAETWFRRAIALRPNYGAAYKAFSITRKTLADDPLLPEMMTRFRDDGLAPIDRANLAFALAKSFEDQKDYDQAFPYMKAANDLFRLACPYDIETRLEEVRALKEALAGLDWTAASPEGVSDCAPIFVTGMPRSGTTLVEQIISSHSLVGSAGETGLTDGGIGRIIETQGGLRPGFRIPDALLAQFSQAYADVLHRRLGKSGRVTDKSIKTYQYMGLVRRALPNARFVVVRRDPRDNLLSIYKNGFREGTHLYSNSLTDLGIYYRTFHEMIEFWRAQLPGGFHEIHYDELVADPEGQSRALIAACGLDWEDGCLNFHDRQSKVNTLSVYQVRQPISRSSQQAWRRYETQLAPMFEALGPLLPQDAAV